MSDQENESSKIKQHFIDNEDDEDDDDDDDDDCKSVNDSIQLGFLESDVSLPLLFNEPDWRKWDGGKVGGKPVSKITLDITII
jgi:hypothetical protein